MEKYINILLYENCLTVITWKHTWKTAQVGRSSRSLPIMSLFFHLTVSESIESTSKNSNIYYKLFIAVNWEWLIPRNISKKNIIKQYTWSFTNCLWSIRDLVRLLYRISNYWVFHVYTILKDNSKAGWNGQANRQMHT